MHIKPRDSCRFDILSLGEVMLRLDPGEGRIRNARQFDVYEGGGEYNVARGLSRCFGMRSALATALADNEVGRLLESLISAGGVDASLIKWMEFDGTGRRVRNGLNFTERGFGVRAPLGVSDRGHSAASQLRTGDIDWEHVFGNLGVRWFHTGGIFAGLSDSTSDVIAEALEAAKRHQTITSYDLNYRASLWKARNGKASCQDVNRHLISQVDVVFGNEEDFTVCLGLPVDGLDSDMKSLPKESYERMIDNATSMFPHLQVIATSLRTVKTASINDWGAIGWVEGQFYHATERLDLQILDRVGGGDSFASGLIFGLMENHDPQLAIEYAVAHGALAMTTPGDTSMASREEVEALLAGSSARIKR